MAHENPAYWLPKPPLPVVRKPSKAVINRLVYNLITNSIQIPNMQPPIVPVDEKPVIELFSSFGYIMWIAHKNNMNISSFYDASILILLLLTIGSININDAKIALTDLCMSLRSLVASDKNQKIPKMINTIKNIPMSKVISMFSVYTYQIKLVSVNFYFTMNILCKLMDFMQTAYKLNEEDFQKHTNSIYRIVVECRSYIKPQYYELIKHINAKINENQGWNEIEYEANQILEHDINQIESEALKIGDELQRQKLQFGRGTMNDNEYWNILNLVLSGIVPIGTLADPNENATDNIMVIVMLLSLLFIAKVKKVLFDVGQVDSPLRLNSPKRKSPKMKLKSPKRKSPKMKMKSPKRKSPKRKSPKRN